MIQTPKIVVLTPVKNEAWSLPRFLATASLWADLIIIADQNSSDESVEICKRFEKTVVIRNENPNFDEAQRQLLLIKTARELVAGPRILVALDADEILAANAPTQPGWAAMLNAKKGTVLYFEKPDIFHSANGQMKCIRLMDNYWPLGFVDDGSDHEPSLIHSKRIPCPVAAPSLHINDVKILHYNLLRKKAHESKRRMYGVIEGLSGNMRWSRRIVHYKANIDWSKQGPIQDCPSSWFEAWESRSIDMYHVPDADFNWQDLEVLKKMKAFGVHHFYWEDIWSFDWEKCRLWALEHGNTEVPAQPIKRPGFHRRFALRFLQQTLLVLRKLRMATKKWRGT